MAHSSGLESGRSRGPWSVFARESFRRKPVIRKRSSAERDE
jgi:hypothetical protein